MKSSVAGKCSTKIIYTQKKIFRNSSAAEDVVTEEYFEKFFCCTKISFA
jgi:hypothetical protein